MKTALRKSIYALLAGILLSSIGCGREDENLIPNQRTAFETFMRGMFGAEGYYEQDGVYVGILNADRDGYEDETVVQRGHTVRYGYAAYRFETGLDLNTALPVFTNVEEWIPEEWRNSTLIIPTPPEIVTLGSTPIITGLERGLPGCRQGDQVLMCITSDLAFGDRAVGILERNTPLVYILQITQVD